MAVSFELILNSIEQSLRLLLLIHFSSLHPIHNLSALYKTLLKKSGGKEGIRTQIVDRVNALGKSLNMGCITEKDICKCLNKHDSSYSSFRYFGLNDEGQATMRWEMKQYEVKILHSLALTLIEINYIEMRERGIPILATMKKLSAQEITDELREMMKRMNEQSTS